MVVATFDETGEADYVDLFNAAVNNFDEYVNYTGEFNYSQYRMLTLIIALCYLGERMSKNLVDLTARSTYDYIGKRPRNAREMAAEYMNVSEPILPYPSLIYDWS